MVIRRVDTYIALIFCLKVTVTRSNTYLALMVSACLPQPVQRLPQPVIKISLVAAESVLQTYVVLDPETVSICAVQTSGSTGSLHTRPRSGFSGSVSVRVRHTVVCGCVRVQTYIRGSPFFSAVRLCL